MEESIAMNENFFLTQVDDSLVRKSIGRLEDVPPESYPIFRKNIYPW